MARKPFKTFSAADASKLKSLVKQFNRKVTEVKKVPTLASAQPTKIRYRDLIKNIQSRNEFNRIYNTYNRYLRRGAERIYTNDSGVRLTRWIRDEARYNVQRINRARAKMREHFENLPGKLRPGAIEELALNPRKNHLATTTEKRYAEKIFEGLLRQGNTDYFKIGAEQYKQNYLLSLRKNYHDVKGFRKFYNFIRGLSGQTLLEAVSEDPTFLIEYNYGFEDGEMKLEYLEEAWQDYLDDREYFAERE